VETSHFDVGGKRTNNLNYDVFLYGDRDLYRPGDTVYYNTIVRTLQWHTVKDLPLKIRILAPNGKEYQSQRKQLSGNGSASGLFFIPSTAMTGTYSIEVFSSNNVLLASRRIAVEEFMPDRIKVSVKTNKASYNAGETVQADIQADNLYGTPAANRKYETELRLSRKSLKPKAFPDYNFTVESKNMPYLATLTNSGTTDAAGKASQVIKPEAYDGIGVLDGTLFTTVFDETGRPVNRLNKVEILTQPVFIGIKNFDEWVSTRKPMNFKLIAVNSEGKAQGNVQAQVVISHLRYETVIERDGNRYRYISQQKESVEFSRQINISSSGAVIPFTPVQSGEYCLKVMLPGSLNYVSSTFYAYGWGDTDYTSFEVNREGEVNISADKEFYQPGNKAKLLFSAPFDGRMLVTFSRNNVLEYKYIDVKNKSASMVFDISEQHLPNVYIEATLFKKITDTEMPLTVAHGVISLKVDEPKTKADVTIKAVEKSRSNTKQVITINTIPNAEVSVAVVDEGILQVTGYASPDPHAWFFQKRALEVNSYDVYGQLFPEMRRTGSSPAGGEAFDLARRINPLTSKRVKLISKWSGILKSDGKGHVSFPVDIPQFSGALRVMAVAYKDDKFGSAEKIIRVADPVIISSALPRFMSPGDKATMIVNVTNTTNNSAKATIEVTADKPLSVSGDSKKSETLEVNREQSLEPGTLSVTEQ
jgi:alpha-2-macroglobulin